jgi:sugar phosphate isomerase/epimerase
MRAMLRADRVALNPLQWINLAADPAVPGSTNRWRYTEPGFRADYPQVLQGVKDAGWSAVMMEVLAVQTLQDYDRLIEDAGLVLAPGYAQIALPEDHDVVLEPGSGARIQWFDGVRRKAEESAYFGLSTIFLAPELGWGPRFPRTGTAVAVGAAFDESRLERQIALIGEAAEVLAAEGVRAGLHNHVGTWVETETEIERVLADLPSLGASFDVGHLVWAGIDPVAMLTRHADRLVDLHIKDLDLSVAAASRATPTGYSTATDAGVFLEPGIGGIDLDGVLAALPEAFDGWIIVEVDRASMPAEQSARLSWEWVAARLG